MIIKAYIGKEMFLLPMKEEKLYAKVPRLSSKYAVNKENYHRRFELSFTNNDDIKVKDNYTNIFLLNLLLHVSNVKEIELEKGEYTNAYIITHLEKLTNQKLNGKKYLEIEKIVYNFTSNCKLNDRINENEVSESVVQEKNVVENKNDVEFNLTWLKEKHKNLLKGDSVNEE